MHAVSFFLRGFYPALIAIGALAAWASADSFYQGPNPQNASNHDFTLAPVVPAESLASIGGQSSSSNSY